MQMMMAIRIKIYDNVRKWPEIKNIEKKETKKIPRENVFV